MAKQSNKSKHDKLRHRRSYQVARAMHLLSPAQLRWMNNAKKFCCRNDFMCPGLVTGVR